MKPHWKEFYKEQAASTTQLGPYFAIGIIKAICEEERSAGEKLEHIRYFLGELDIIVAQKKEA